MAMRELARQLIQTGAISLGPHGGQNEANVHSLGLADEDDDGDLDERSQSSDSEDDGDVHDHGGEQDDAKTALGTAVLVRRASITMSADIRPWPLTDRSSFIASVFTFQHNIFNLVDAGISPRVRRKAAHHCPRQLRLAYPTSETSVALLSAGRRAVWQLSSGFGRRWND